MIQEAVPLQVSLICGGIVLHTLSLFFVIRIFAMFRKHKWLALGRKNVALWIGLSVMIAVFLVSHAFFAASTFSVYSMAIYTEVLSLAVAIFAFTVVYMQFDLYKHLASVKPKRGGK